MIFQYGAAICTPNQFSFGAEFFTSKNKYGAAIPPRYSIFYFAVLEKPENQYGAAICTPNGCFLSGAPQGCELQQNLIKHKVLGSLFGTQNGTMWSRGAKKDLPRPYVL